MSDLKPATHDAPLNWHMPADYAEAVEMLRRAKRDLENPMHAALMMAIDALKKEVSPEDWDDDAEYSVMHVLEKLAAEYPPSVCVPVEDGWISVDKKLPPDGKFLGIHEKHNEPMVLQWGGNLHSLSNITHWRPIPTITAARKP